MSSENNTSLSGTAIKTVIDFANGMKGLAQVPQGDDAKPIPGLLAAVVPQGWTVQQFDYEKLLPGPRRRTGHYTVNSVKSFIDMVEGFKTETSRVYQQRSRDKSDDVGSRICAVINDHGGAVNGFGDLRVTLALDHSAQWDAWTEKFGSWLLQEQLAEFLEEHSGDVTRPNGADMLKLALNFEATKGIDFSQAQRLQDGTVSIKYEDKTTPAVAVPETIDVRLAPYYQDEREVDVTCRLRYRVDARRVMFKMEPVLWQDALEVVHASTLELIKAGMPLPIIAGAPRV